MFNGVVRELNKVWYVLSLKKNQNFLDDLEAKDYKFTIKNGTIKFTYEATVILQEKYKWWSEYF